MSTSPLHTHRQTYTPGSYKTNAPKTPRQADDLHTSESSRSSGAARWWHFKGTWKDPDMEKSWRFQGTEGGPVARAQKGGQGA